MKYIFNDYQDFLDNKEENQNWFSQKFLKDNNLTIKKALETLKDCEDCFNCIHCVQCYNCEDCKHCKIVENSQRCNFIASMRSVSDMNP